MNAKSRSDWDKVRAISEDSPIHYEPGDGPYDPNDIQATRKFFGEATAVRGRGQRGPQKSPTKQKITMRLSSEVIAYFKATGPGWQTRVDETLKAIIRRK